jgi:hypothetical protein
MKTAFLTLALLALGVMPSPASETTTTTNQSAAPVANVFSNYLRIEKALAKDSTEGLSANARAIATLIKEDPSHVFAATVGQQAEALAKASALPAARKAFKSLSASLIEFRSKNPQLLKACRQVHCPMADADWLQTEAVVSNPYYGKAMATCGEFVTP